MNELCTFGTMEIMSSYVTSITLENNHSYLYQNPNAFSWYLNMNPMTLYLKALNTSDVQ